jgi:flagellar hook protein FlgE
MGIFGAMNTAVSGLRSQSYAMENISGNIANSQTIGFKRVETSFVDLVAERPRAQVLAGSVRGFGRQAIDVQGDVRPTGVPTNMAVNGSGFFSVSQMSGFRDGAPVFSETNLFTRRGDFQLDKDGYLVNGAGMYLRGDSINLDGLVTSSNGVLRVADTSVPASATNEITYSAILPQIAGTTRYNGQPGSDLLVGPDSPFAAPVTTITAGQSNDFLGRTISGGSVILYNSIGAPIDLQMRWGKVGENQWALFYQNNSRAQNGETMWTSMGEVTFDATGVPSAAPNFGFPAAPTLINGVELPDPLDFNIGPSGLRQFSQPNNLMSSLDLRQNGYPTGNLQDVEISGDGRITGIYSNGQSFAIARLSIAQFAAPNMLKARDGGTFEATMESGDPVISPEGARIVAGSVEESNADIAEEFTKMIVTQQAYTANTRVVTTAQQMMESTINMVR